MGSEPVPTDLDDTTSAVRHVLGSGMAHRARTQTVLGAHWSSSGTIGAVGKASVGFGLAVGRSSAIRPSVSYGDLNTAALRPSLEGWRARLAHRPADDASPTTEVGPGVDAGVDLATPAVSSRSGASRSNRNSASDRTSSGRGSGRHQVARRRVAERPTVPVPVRRQPAAAARPTWTDQVIQRSSIGYSRSAPVTAASAAPTASALPEGFAPSGDAKLDRLRLLVAQRDAGPTSGGNAAAAAGDRGSATGTGASTGQRRAASDGASPASVRGGRANESDVVAPSQRGDTAAGQATGPGRFARSMRPERVGEAPSAAPSPRGGAVSPTRSGATAPLGAGSGATVRRTPATPRGRAAKPDRMAELRAALEAQGFFGDAEATGANDRGERRPGSCVGVEPVGARHPARGGCGGVAQRAGDIHPAAATDQRVTDRIGHAPVGTVDERGAPSNREPGSAAGDHRPRRPSIADRINAAGRIADVGRPGWR